VVGCLLMLFGSHPLMAYAIVGLGAAAYSPAKYGILTELLPPSQLVKANGWIEGLTIASIILGVLLGGQLVGPPVARQAGPDLAGHHHAVLGRQRQPALIVFAWAAAALGYSTTQASNLVGVVILGTVPARWWRR
jgi:MFS family permease